MHQVVYSNKGELQGEEDGDVDARCSTYNNYILNILLLYCKLGELHIFSQCIYRRIGSISTGTNIRKVRIFAVPTAWGTYNHGVLYDGTQKYVVKDT